MYAANTCMSLFAGVSFGRGLCLIDSRGWHSFLLHTRHTLSTLPAPSFAQSLSLYYVHSHGTPAASYSRAHVYLLDDPLSAVDTKVRVGGGGHSGVAP